MDISSILGLGAVFALVALNGFFVAAEFALVSVRRTRVEQLVTEGKGSAKAVQKAVTHLDGYIAATQLGITLASLALGWIGEPAIAHLVEPVLGLFLPGGATGALTHTIGLVISFTIITAMHIVLGELAPKTVALQRAEGTALFVARPLEVFRIVFWPFISLMNTAGRFVVRIFGLSATDEHARVHSVEELEMLVTESREAGYLDKDEEVLLRRVFDFNDKTARQVMTPRTEVMGVPEEATLDTLISLAADERYTRFPVYHDSLDSIIGVVHVKDLFGLLRNGFSPDQGNQTFKLSQIMRPALNVPETAHVAELLTQMRSRQVHMAIIIDEYGGTAGVVTLEDILEEIVGDMRDEFDTTESGAEHEIEVAPDGTTLVSGLYSLQDAAERFGLSVTDEELGEFDTLGGYVQGHFGRIPKLGDNLLLSHYQLKVEQMDGLRVDRVRLTPVEQEESVSAVRSSRS